MGIPKNEKTRHFFSQILKGNTVGSSYFNWKYINTETLPLSGHLYGVFNYLWYRNLYTFLCLYYFCNSSMLNEVLKQMLQTLCSVITPINKTDMCFCCIVRGIWRYIYIIHLCYCATVRKCRRKNVCAHERGFLWHLKLFSGDETVRTAVHQNKLFLEALFLLTVIYNIIYAGWVSQNDRICYFNAHFKDVWKIF